MLGQLVHAERELIYRTVYELQPSVCVECGTYNGLGSTLYITQALLENAREGRTIGKLYTFETDKTLYEQSKNIYKQIFGEIYEQCCVFSNAKFLDGIVNVPTPIQFAMLDGPEDQNYTNQSFEYINARMNKGAVIIFHDWKINKCASVRNNPTLKNN